MKNLVHAICLIFLTGCATKYLVPSNRFLSPESQGGTFRGQVEFGQTFGNQLTIVTENGTVQEGVVYGDVSRSAFLVSESIFNRFDVIWSHLAAGNSMLGGKLQFLGGSRTENQTGHKASLSMLVGGNRHITDDEMVEFTLQGREYILSYGYRFSQELLPYFSLSSASYGFDGEVTSSDPILNGLKPSFVTDALTANLGLEFSFDSFVAKLEVGYQQLSTTDTPVRMRPAFGYSLGYSW